MGEQESTAIEAWWELPELPYRPQHLQLQYLLEERQPTGPQRTVDLALMMLEIDLDSADI